MSALGAVDVLYLILNSLRGVDQVRAAGVCRLWRELLSRCVPIERAAREDRLFSVLLSDYVSPEAYRVASVPTICAMVRRFGSPPLKWLATNTARAEGGAVNPELWFVLSGEEVTALLRVLCAARRLRELESILSFDRTRAVLDATMRCGFSLGDREVMALARRAGGRPPRRRRIISPK